MRWTLAFSAAIHLLAAAAFVLVAWTLSRRKVTAGGKLPALAFVVWWSSLAAYMGIQAALQLSGALGEPPLGVFLAARVVTIPVLCASVWGLALHVLYLYTGSRRLAVPLAIFYGVVGVAFYVASFQPMPTGVAVGPWLVELEGTGQGPLYRAVYAAVGLPPIVGSLAYLTLARRAPLPSHRFRIVLVSVAILAWVGSGLAARLGQSDVAKFVTLSVFGLGAAAAVLLAYRPPPPLAAWLARRDAEAEGIALEEPRARADHLIGRPST